jgi:predicted nuclease with RNAse H fold
MPPCLRCTEAVCPGQDACVDAEVVVMRALAGGINIDARAAASEVTHRDSRRGKPTITPYTQRATDLYLRRRGLFARETLGQGMGPLTARAAHLVRALAPDFRVNDNLIEVYPRATLELSGISEPYKKCVDRRIDILTALSDLAFGPGVWREECRKSDHAFDAVLCAYTGYLRQRDGWRVAPQVADQPPAANRADGIDRWGWIWVPPEVSNKGDAADALPQETGRSS